MKHRFTPLFFLLVCILSLRSEARAELATVFFKDGKTMTVELVGVERAQLLWKENASSTDVVVTPRSQVENVIFPTTEAWRNAENAFESGQLDEALKLYQEVIADPTGHFFPLPGNFASLAKERVLGCYRLQLDASKIAKQAQVVREEFFHLPPELNRIEPETAAWTAIANEKWAAALTALEGIEAPGAEAFFLKGRVLEALGRKEEAVSEYAGAYVLNFGGSILLTRQSLQRSSQLIHEMGDPDKKAELQAQVKIYRDLYGKGNLWEGAPAELASLAEGEIQPLGDAENEMAKPGESGSMEGTVVEESATVATLAAKEDRDFLLAEELADKFYVIGAGDGNETLTPTGGVTKEGESYRFDGTGGFLRLEPFNANTPFLQLRMQFEAGSGNGILAHTSQPRLGGFTLYLKEGELLMDYQPRRAKIMTAVLGRIESGKLINLAIVIRTDGTRNTVIGDLSSEDTVPAGGLKIPQMNHLILGDSGEGDESGKTLSGVSLPFFDGVIHHFSLGVGASNQEVTEKTVARFGKAVRLLPPPPETAGE